MMLYSVTCLQFTAVTYGCGQRRGAHTTEMWTCNATMHTDLGAVRGTVCICHDLTTGRYAITECPTGITLADWAPEGLYALAEVTDDYLRSKKQKVVS